VGCCVHHGGGVGTSPRGSTGRRPGQALGWEGPGIGPAEGADEGADGGGSAPVGGGPDPTGGSTGRSGSAGSWGGGSGRKESTLISQ
jgi:translation initiation factor IF-2